jgi:transcription antitermination factor NusG
MRQLTTTTIVQKQVKIRQTRLLPHPGEIIAKMGQTVKPFQTIARTLLKSDFHILPVAEELGIAAEALPEYLQVVVGQSVDTGELIAEKKRLLGWQRVMSPREGVVVEISNGRVMLQQRTDWYELRALMAGNVVNFIPDQGVVLETSGSLIQGVWANGQEGFGAIRNVAMAPDFSLTAAQIDDDDSENILVAGKIDRLDTLTQAEFIGVRGIIAGSMSAELCRASLSLSYPIILTEGVGRQVMSLPIFELLQEMEQKAASLFGRYQAAEGQRPEIVIAQPATVGTEAPKLVRSVKVGQKVRILRAPYASQVGEVVRLYQLAQTTSVNIKAHGVDVQLADGQVIFIPGKNFDTIVS